MKAINELICIPLFIQEIQNLLLNNYIKISYKILLYNLFLILIFYILPRYKKNKFMIIMEIICQLHL